jgi:hypothetical protein
MNRVTVPYSFPASPGRTAVTAGIFASFLAVGLYMAKTTVLSTYSWRAFDIDAAMKVVVCAGLLFAALGFIQGLWGRGKCVILFALTGLLLNGGVFTLVFRPDYSIFVHQFMKGRSGRATLVQLNCMPQVFKGSFTVFDPQYGFRLELPEGFVKNKDSAPARGTIHSYIRHGSGNKPDTIVNIKRLYITLLPRKGKPSVDELENFKREKRKSFPHAVLVRVEQEQWKTHTLDMFLAEMPVGGEMQSEWSVQIPLAGEAVRLEVSGLKGYEDQYREVIIYILKSLQANSSWK